MEYHEKLLKYAFHSEASQNKFLNHLIPFLHLLILKLIDKKKKRHPNWNGRTKAMFADDTVLYIESPKDSINKTLLDF